MRATTARGGLLALAVSVLCCQTAGAHVTVQPAASRPADLQLYRVLVPNEEDNASTIGVDLQLPQGVDFVLMQRSDGWKTTIVRDGGRPTELRWAAGRIPPGGYDELHFIARNPVRIGAIRFKTLQRYSDGDVVRWINTSPDSENPAPTVRLAENVVPQDIVSVHGERVPTERSSAALAPTAAPSATDDGGNDGLTLAVSIAALVLAGGALLVTLRRSRRG